MKRASVALAGVVAISIIGVAFALGGRIYKADKSPGQVKAMLDSALPLGIDERAVVSYLERRDIEHSDYDKKDRTVHAIVRDACWSVFLECSADIVLSFDEKGALFRISVTEGLTGL